MKKLFVKGIVWPSHKECVAKTAAVIVVSAIAAGIFLGCDAAFGTIFSILA